jgi:hypothetical protein
MADQPAQVDEVLLGSLAFARSDALPFGNKVLGGEGGHGRSLVCERLDEQIALL